MIKIEFTKEQIQAQIQLNDIAVKAGGLQVAEAAVVLSKILQAGLEEPEPVKEDSGSEA